MKNNRLLCPINLKPNLYHLQVRYVGRIRVSHKKGPPSFVDDALAKLKHVELPPSGAGSPTGIIKEPPQTSQQQQTGGGITKNIKGIDTVINITRKRENSLTGFLQKLFFDDGSENTADVKNESTTSASKKTDSAAAHNKQHQQRSRESSIIVNVNVVRPTTPVRPISPANPIVDVKSNVPVSKMRMKLSFV
jgi:hypothetical protein